jgi:hypothetical protein
MKGLPLGLLTDSGPDSGFQASAQFFEGLRFGYLLALRASHVDLIVCAIFVRLDTSTTDAEAMIGHALQDIVEQPQPVGRFHADDGTGG